MSRDGDPERSLVDIYILSTINNRSQLISSVSQQFINDNIQRRRFVVNIGGLDSFSHSLSIQSLSPFSFLPPFPYLADWGGGISVVLHRIMRRGIISSCQSTATSEIVKRCCSSLCKQRYCKYSDLYPFTFSLSLSLSRSDFRPPHIHL